MSDHSAIQWTDATWNPTTGCTKVSPGCAHCYIDRTPPFRKAHRRFVDGQIPLQLHPDRLEQPLHWKTPRRIFVNSLSDLFHDAVPDQFLHDVYNVMERANHHRFQVLTKRPQRMQQYLEWRWGEGRIAPRHIWHGVSVENQRLADERIPLLLQTRTRVRFISVEPLLAPVRLQWEWVSGGRPWGGGPQVNLQRPWEAPHPRPRLDWIIIGGESGPGARPFDLRWARSIVRQCAVAGVACFVKQLGTNLTADYYDDETREQWWEATGRTWPDPIDWDVRDGQPAPGSRVHLPLRYHGDPAYWPADLRVREFPQT